MKAPKWNEAIAREYNPNADVNLKYYVSGDPRWADRVARAVRAPASALLSFAYSRSPFAPGMAAALAAVRAYNPRSVAGFPMPSTRVVSPRQDLPELQRTIQRMIGAVILRPPGDDAENPSTAWTLPVSFAATVWCARSSAYGLGPELKDVEPRWVADAIRACSVLLDAIPWLRFCALCGRVFFKVKQQRVCSLRCRRVRQSRERWSRSRKTHPLERRGRPRTPYRESFDGAHTAWLRMVDERKITNARGLFRQARRQG
jgi:hypothetical protein